MNKPAKIRANSPHMSAKLLLCGLAALCLGLLLAPAYAEEGLAPAAPGKWELPEGAPDFFPKEVHPAIAVEGFYLAEVENMPNVSTMHVEIKKGVRYAPDDDNYYRWSRENDSRWILAARPIYPGEKAITNGTFNSVDSGHYTGGLKVSDEGVITFRANSNQQLLDTGFRVELKPQGGFDSFVGEWKVGERYKGDGPRRGAIRMRRLEQLVSEVRVEGRYSIEWHKRFAETPQIYDSAPPRSRPLRVVIPETDRGEFGPGKRGPYTYLHVSVIGSEMWTGDHGFAYVWMPKDSGFGFNPYYGVVPVKVTDGDGNTQVIGQTTSVAMSRLTTEGLHTIWINGIPVTLDVDFAWTDEEDETPAVRSLEAIGEDGTPLNALAEGDVFRLRATLNRASAEERLTATVPADEVHEGSGFSVALSRTANASTFESELLRMQWDNSAVTALKEKLGDKWNGAASRDIAIKRFRGKWDIAAGDGETVIGAGEINDAGDALFMTLGSADAPRVYKSTEVYAEEEWLNGAPAARLRAVMERRPDFEARLKRGGALNPEGRGLNIGRWRTALDFTLGDKTASVKIVAAGRSDEKPFKLALIAFSTTSALDGEFFVPAAEGEAAQRQQQTWTRHNPVEITRVVLLDDQLGLHFNKDAPHPMRPNYAYPYDTRYGDTGGAKTRMLVVFGKNLPSQEAAIVESESDNIVYTAPLLAPDVRQGMRIGAHQIAGTDMLADEDWLVLRAYLREEVAPGVKTLAINKRQGQWALAFNDAVGSIRFLREGTSPSDIEERQFYFGEKIRLGVVAANRALPIDNISLIVEGVKGEGETAQRRRLGIVPLTPEHDPDANIAMSEKFLLGREGEDIAGDGAAFLLDEGERLEARLADRVSLFAIPAAASAEVLGEPVNSELWNEAITRVMRCPGITGGPDDPGFLAESHFSTERRILTAGLENRNERISNGDHAALILIRDKLVPMIQDENSKLAPYLSEPDKRLAAMRYLNAQRDIPGAMQSPFWTQLGGDYLIQIPMSGTPPIAVSYRLGEAADLPALRDKINAKIAANYPAPDPVNIPDMRDMMLDAIARHMRNQYDATNQAIARANEAGDCNIAELLIIAGQKSDRAVSEILPQLMIRTGDGWEPDTVARGYVRSVHIAGAATRALNDWADLDDAYKSMAVAAGAAILTGGGSLITAAGWAAGAEAATAGAALVINAADAVYFAKKDLSDYFASEENYETALGLSPVLGGDVLDDAENRRGNLLAASVSVLAPSIGALGDLSALRHAKAIGRGRAITRTESGLDYIDMMDNETRAQIAAYHAYLREAQQAKTAVLTTQEAADLEKLDALVNARAGADTLPLSAETGGAIPPTNPPLADNAERADDAFDRELDDLLGDPNAPVIDLAGGDDMIRIDPAGGAPQGPDIFGDSVFDGPTEPGGVGKILGRIHSDRASDAVVDAAPVTVGSGRDARRVLPDGTVVTDPNSGEEIVLRFKEDGSEPNMGSFSATYRDDNDPAYVAKIRLLPKGAPVGAEYGRADMSEMILDSEVGREILEAAETDARYFKVAERKGDPFVVQSSAAPDLQFYVTREQNIASEVHDLEGNVIMGADGRPVTATDFHERLRARRADHLARLDAANIKPKPADHDLWHYASSKETALHNLAVRELNQKGIIWTDNKKSNFDIVGDADAPLKRKVMFFDYDGVRLVNATPDPGETLERAKWRTARNAQRDFDNAHNRKTQGPALADLAGMIVDPAPYGDLYLGISTSYSQNKVSRIYRNMNNSSATEFEQMLKIMFPDDDLKFRNFDTEATDAAQ